MTQVIEPQVVDQLQMDQPKHQELANGADLGEANPPSNQAAKKKKKKRKNKKPSNATADDKSSAEGAKDSEHSAPSNKVLLAPGELYPNGDFPIGEIQEYTTQPWRSTSREKQDLDKLTQDVLGNLRRAAEVHRKVRQWTKAHVIRPGVPLIEIAQKLESEVWRLVEKDGLKAGSAFPTGLSLNHIAAHFSPNTGDKNIFGASDVLKVDFGVHVNGYIIDSAFTVSYDPTFDPLINAVKEATNTGVKLAGIDARLGEIGAGIQEVMESHEVIINGKVYPVKSIKNLCGHDIHPYLIHAGKSVPSVKTNDNTKMEENEHYAIETFGSTGRGQIHEDYECSHYSKNGDARANVRSATAKQLLSHINQRYGTLTFCRRWLDDEGQTRHLLALKQLVDQGVVTPHPPFVDIKGSYTAQWEHTLFLRPTCKEVLSRGDDY